MLVVVAGMAAAVFHLGLPWWVDEGDHHHVYESDDGSLHYQVHLPPQHDETTWLPVIMAIHGCGMSGFGWNSMKSMTQFNDLADREGFIVVYPTQRLFRSAINCWNSADPRQQHRHTGEFALLGVAREVIETYGADPDQVHVAGASSGAATEVILAATYPGHSPRRALDSGERPRRRRSAQRQPRRGRGHDEGSCRTGQERLHAHHHHLTERQGDREFHLVHGMGHVWPGPAGDGLFTDRAGPDASVITWEFARRHSQGPAR